MRQQQKELLDIQTNANEADNSDSSNRKIVDREQYKGTYIWIIGIDEGWFAAIGEHRVTAIMNTKEEIIKLLENKEWETIGLVIAVMMSGIEKEITERMWRKIEDKMNSDRRIMPTL